ncbi:MAG: protein kinase [Clostridia bacterium]|nr:protein kinase [Clostridia bacterium]
MIDTILSDRYVLREQIGSGGMSVVYLAWDILEKREVAIKVLRSEFNDDDEFIRRFNLEAKAASKMSHPNIVRIYGAEQDGDVRYIVMEYVKGRTLKKVIRQSGKIKPERAIHIALKILAAVDCAHRNNVIHRDIKPQNILVDVEGNIKVADFGIARATNSSTRTYTDMSYVMGSVHYFSPEQASGQVADEKSDLYSVGVVLYEMVTGVVPFDGDTAITVALKHLQEAPKSAKSVEPSVSKGIDEVILKSLEKEASHRYQTATEMARDLKLAIRYPRGGFVGKSSEHGYGFAGRVRSIVRSENFWQRFRHWTLGISCFMLMALVIYYGAMLYRYLFVRMQMPSLYMLDIEDAVATLDQYDLRYTIEQMQSDDVRYGFILEQSPDAGQTVWPGDHVELIMSTGKATVEMPKLTEITRTEATRLIDEADLAIGEVTLIISQAAPGTVVEQNPAAGTIVKAGDSVDLKVSGECARMPDLTGYTTSEARGLLVACGFVLGNVTERLSEYENGVIIDQNIAPGTITLTGDRVNVVISREIQKPATAQTTVAVSAPNDGVEMVCTIVESTGEREVYRAILAEGKQEITMDLESSEPGEHIVRLYLNGELRSERTIVFIEDE